MHVKDYCYIIQPKADHQRSKIQFRDFGWISPYVVDKVLPNEKYIAAKTTPRILKIQIASEFAKLLPIRPKDSYTSEKFRPDADIVIPQDDLYSIAWEAESSPSLLDDPKL